MKSRGIVFCEVCVDDYVDMGIFDFVGKVDGFLREDGDFGDVFSFEYVVKDGCVDYVCGVCEDEMYNVGC